MDGEMVRFGDTESVAGLQVTISDLHVSTQYKYIDTIAGEDGVIAQCLACAEVGQRQTGTLVDPEGVVGRQGADDGLPLIDTALRRECLLIMTGADIELPWEDPDLEEVDGVEMRGVVFRMLDAAAGGHDLHIPCTEDSFDAGAVFMSQGPFQGNGNDLHVLVGMGIESVAAFDHIIVEDAQGTEMYLFPVMPIPETKRVMAVQPAEIYMASFRGGMVYVIHKTDLYRWRRSVLREINLDGIVRTVRIEFHDKIIPSFPYQDIHIILLHEFQHGKKHENSVQPGLTDLEYFLE